MNIADAARTTKPVLGEADDKIATLRARVEVLETALREIKNFPYVGRQAEQQIRLIAGAALTPDPGVPK